MQIIANALEKSFGPKGSTTAIVKNMDKNGVNISLDYTKDGHTIVKSIAFENPIERSVQDILVELTRYVVKEAGDGTRSAVLLCNSIFKCLCDNGTFSASLPADIIDKFNKVIAEVNKRILEKGRECTLEDIYNIALISTNNNEDLAAAEAAIAFALTSCALPIKISLEIRLINRERPLKETKSLN